MKIAIVVALQSELECTKRLFSDIEDICCDNVTYYFGECNGHQIIVSQSGIGKVCAATRCHDIITNFEPDCIINTGLAGGIDIKSKVCDVVVGSEVAYHDVWCGDGNEIGQVQGFPLKFEGDKMIVNKILADRTDEERIYKGLICTGDQFITDDNRLKEIKDNFKDAIAVDMESAAFAHCCYMKGVPFVSIRVISDTPGSDDNIEQYNNFWEVAPEKSFDVIKDLIYKL